MSNELLSEEADKILEENFQQNSCEGQCAKQCHKIDGPLYSLKLIHSSETELAVFDDNLNKGDFVVAETRYGVDLVEVLGEIKSKTCNRALIPILRKATQQDLSRQEENQYKAKEAFYLAKQKIAEHKLEMKLVDAAYLLEENKILFLFTADQRVDFRELVKDLVSTFHARIELRQIGVRDETRAIGGLAVCGRDYCCHGVTDQLKPVSIKMVKDQNLSLNSIKISGSCGRLLCCLAYEHDFYAEERKELPNDNTRIKINNELWRIHEVNVISRKILLMADDGRYLSLPIDQFYKDSNDNRWHVKTMN